jgi:polysaccharide export outer membrane protein
MGVSLVAMLLASAAQSRAQDSIGSIPLPPLTKLHLSIVQFMPATGDFKRWDALGGDMQVADDGTITVPSLGTIVVGSSPPDTLADEIASKLQQKLGLVDRPDASIQVLEYPPVFLSGAVTSPGQYAFRPGMTVLQAVALAGGEFREAGSSGGKSNVVTLRAQLQTATQDLLRGQARIARLQAELEGRRDISFPATMDAKDPAIAAVMTQERAILDARENEVSRQTAALKELASLFRSQIDVLGQKAASIDTQIAETQHQLDGVKDLVAKGVVMASRQSDLDRELSGLKGDLLDNTIATMNAQLGMSGASRDLAKLEDDQRSTIAEELQTAQVAIEHLRISQTSTVQLLQLAGRQAEDDADKADAQQITPSYTIVRRGSGGPIEIAATEGTVLLPGDVLKVTLPDLGGAAHPVNAAQAEADAKAAL